MLCSSWCSFLDAEIFCLWLQWESTLPGGSAPQICAPVLHGCEFPQGLGEWVPQLSQRLPRFSRQAAHRGSLHMIAHGIRHCCSLGDDRFCSLGQLVVVIGISRVPCVRRGWACEPGVRPSGVWFASNTSLWLYPRANSLHNAQTLFPHSLLVVFSAPYSLLQGPSGTFILGEGAQHRAGSEENAGNGAFQLEFADLENLSSLAERLWFRHGPAGVWGTPCLLPFHSPALAMSWAEPALPGYPRPWIPASPTAQLQSFSWSILKSLGFPSKSLPKVQFPKSEIQGCPAPLHATQDGAFPLWHGPAFRGFVPRRGAGLAGLTRCSVPPALTQLLWQP